MGGDTAASAVTHAPPIRPISWAPGYSVQGNGSLDRVPAFYGFVCPPSVFLNDANDIIASALTHANPELFDKLKRFAKKNFNTDLGSKGAV